MVKSVIYELSFLGYSIIVSYLYHAMKMYELVANISLPIYHVLSISPIAGDGLR